MPSVEVEILPPLPVTRKVPLLYVAAYKYGIPTLLGVVQLAPSVEVVIKPLMPSTARKFPLP